MWTTKQEKTYLQTAHKCMLKAPLHHDGVSLCSNATWNCSFWPFQSSSDCSNLENLLKFSGTFWPNNILSALSAHLSPLPAAVKIKMRRKWECWSAGGGDSHWFRGTWTGGCCSVVNIHTSMSTCEYNTPNTTGWTARLINVTSTSSMIWKFYIKIWK